MAELGAGVNVDDAAGEVPARFDLWPQGKGAGSRAVQVGVAGRSG